MTWKCPPPPRGCSGRFLMCSPQVRLPVAQSIGDAPDTIYGRSWGERFPCRTQNFSLSHVRNNRNIHLSQINAVSRVGLLEYFSYGEAPPWGPSFYPLKYLFLQKRHPFGKPSRENSTPFNLPLEWLLCLSQAFFFFFF